MSFLSLILVSFSASAMVGGKAVSVSDPIVSQVAQIATWTESHTTAKTFDGDVISESSKRVVPNCTATFVAEDLLLTAAHCIAKPNSLKIDLGWSASAPVQFHGVGRISDSGKEVSFSIVDSRVPSSGEDLALVKIDSKFQSRGLPLLARKPLLHEQILSYGFGEKQPVNISKGISLDVAKPTMLQTLSPQFFHQSLTQTLTQGAFRSLKVDSESVTLVRKSGQGGHCYGDSGGPNLIPLKEGISVVGVTIQVLPNADAWVCSGESAILNVGPSAKWLNQAAAELGSHLVWVK